MRTLQTWSAASVAGTGCRSERGYPRFLVVNGLNRDVEACFFGLCGRALQGTQSRRHKVASTSAENPPVMRPVRPGRPEAQGRLQAAEVPVGPYTRDSTWHSTTHARPRACAGGSASYHRCRSSHGHAPKCDRSASYNGRLQLEGQRLRKFERLSRQGLRGHSAIASRAIFPTGG